MLLLQKPDVVVLHLVLFDLNQFQQTVITYDPGSPGAQAYVKVAKEFAHRHAGVN